MKKSIILKTLLLFVLVTVISCDRDEREENTLPGEWVEVQPVRNRTTLIFASGKRLTRIDGEGNEEYYTYEIDGDSIFISLVSGQEGSTELFFKKLDPGRFRIGNLYASTPESEEVIMVFERF